MSISKHGLFRGIIALILCLATIAAMTIPAFAYSPSDDGKGDSVIEAKEELTLTPEGNMELVDDISEEESDHLQYMTVVTKDGNYFYIIVDRSKNTDNVHFLNKVDEPDLMSLMDEEELEAFKEPVIEPETEAEETESVEMIIESEPEPVRKNNGPAVLMIMLALGGGAFAAYYFYKKKAVNAETELDELEFYDDEGYVNEDTVEEDSI